MSWGLQVAIAVPVISGVGYLIGLAQTLIRRRLRAHALSTVAPSTNRLMGHDRRPKRGHAGPVHGQQTH